MTRLEPTVVCHDNPVFEPDYKCIEQESLSKPLIDTQTKIVITSIHKNQENFHLSQVKNLEHLNENNHNIQTTATAPPPPPPPAISEELLETESQLVKNSSNQVQLNTSNNNISTNTNGAYAIASSTTLVYITSASASPQTQQQITQAQPKLEETTNLLPSSSNTNSAKGSISSAKRFKAITPTSNFNSYNTVDKLAAAAAAAVSSTADSLVEIPNFGQSLSSMMDHNKMVSFYPYYFCYLN